MEVWMCRRKNKIKQDQEMQRVLISSSQRAQAQDTRRGALQQEQRLLRLLPLTYTKIKY